MRRKLRDLRRYLNTSVFQFCNHTVDARGEDVGVCALTRATLVRSPGDHVQGVLNVFEKGAEVGHRSASNPRQANRTKATASIPMAAFTVGEGSVLWLKRLDSIIGGVSPSGTGVPKQIG